jgi:hypothetical protein
MSAKNLLIDQVSDATLRIQLEKADFIRRWEDTLNVLTNLHILTLLILVIKCNLNTHSVINRPLPAPNKKF